jgi:hypothetical protein
MATSKWFEQRKDFIFKEVVREHLKNNLYCRDLYASCKREGEIPFASMDYWVGTETRPGPLWQFKDTCHGLFRNSGKRCGLREYLFDWAVGAAFHAAMKLKEDVYLLGSYRLRHDALEGCTDPVILKRLEKCRLITGRLAGTLLKQLRDIRHLMDEASRQLRDLLADQRHNKLLMRFLVEEEREVAKVWGPGAVDQIFRDAFPQGAHIGYCLAGQSYLEGGWYEDAHDAFQRALNVNPKSLKARRGLSEARQLLKR